MNGSKEEDINLLILLIEEAKTSIEEKEEHLYAIKRAIERKKQEIDTFERELTKLKSK